MTNHVNSADGVRIAYTTKGECEPALVFIHGGLADRTCWSNQIDVFGERYKVVALDLAGHGESGTTPILPPPPDSM
jgi:pimeloyl-ACP methyl ester carboxylesterase